MFKKALVLSSGNFVNTVITGLFGIYVTRVLGPDNKGILALALGTCDLMSMLFSLGVPYSASYYIRSHPGSGYFILKQANRTMIICGLLSTILVFVGKDAFSSFFLGGRAVDGVLWTLLIFTVIVNSGNTIVGSTLVAQGDSRGYVVSTNAGAFVNVAATFLLIVTMEQRLHAVLIGNLAGILTATVMMRRQYYRSLPHEAVPHGLDARRFFSYGIQSQSGAIASLLFKRMDLYIIGHYLDVGAVGFYSVGLGLRDLVMTASRAYAGLAAGEMSDSERRADGTARTILRKGILFNIVASIFIFIGAVIFFPFFIPFVYGAAFAGSVHSSLLIMGSLLPFSVAFLIGKAILANGKPMHQSISSVASAVISSFIIWQLTQRFGLTGAASATIANSLILLGFSWVFLRLSDNDIFMKPMKNSRQ